jgi:Lar family restriction alleviation protein
MKELKSCPFCGSTARVLFEYITDEKKHWYAQAQCITCFATTTGDWQETLKEAKQEAIQKWNRRSYEES